MKIYGNSPSPFVRHCRIALIESGLDFEFLIDTDYQLSRQRSPTQRIPFLEYRILPIYFSILHCLPKSEALYDPEV